MLTTTTIITANLPLHVSSMPTLLFHWWWVQFFSFKNCSKIHVTLKLTILTNFECMDPWHEVLIHLHCCTGCVILSGDWTSEGVGVLLWVRVLAPCCLHLWAQHIADVSRVLHRDSGDHCLVVLWATVFLHFTGFFCSIFLNFMNLRNEGLGSDSSCGYYLLEC